MKRKSRAAATVTALCGAAAALAQVPDHPIISEVYFDPPGLNDGPIGREPSNAHQEFIELYLPTAAQLRAGLNKDNLRLTFYEIEGDSTNANRGHVTQRYDLPGFDLDPSNGTTPGAINRPTSGVVLLSWVDYNQTSLPPTALLGTPASRVALINGGITVAPTGTTLIAINGSQFGGTSNFATPVAESKIDVPGDSELGVMNSGSSAYLLVNRDLTGYVALADYHHPELGASNPALPAGTTLRRSCLMDAFAGNDDSKFIGSAQPLTPGQNIDLEDVLPAGGAFSLWVPQVTRSDGEGFLRRFIDVRKTTEDAVSGNELPATDADAYWHEASFGPFYPTPGSVIFSTAAPRLSVAQSSRSTYDVLPGTAARPGVPIGNVGGNYGIGVVVSTGPSSDPSIAAFSNLPGLTGIMGQVEAFPQFAVNVPAGTPAGATASTALSITATNMIASDPAVESPSGNAVATIHVIEPMQGVDDFGFPKEATAYAAVFGLGLGPALNEFRASSLGNFVSQNLGGAAKGSLNHLPALLDTTTNLESFAVVSPLIVRFPATTSAFINAPAPAGTADLVSKVAYSSKVLSGSIAYAQSMNSSQTAVKAIQVLIPETLVSGGTYVPTEEVFYADALGDLGHARSGLSFVTTTRGFELAIVDTNVTSTTIESSDADDFGLIVEVGQVNPGAAVQSGEFLFLSYMGGLEGEDIDTLDVPGDNATNLILFDLDNLETVLGVHTIRRAFIVDAGVGGTLDPMEVISLNALHGVLSVTPTSEFVAAGPPGGPFTPPSAVYMLSNHGNAPLNWTADDGVDWLDISPSTGQLAPGESISVIVATNAQTALLASGSHAATLTLTNTSGGSGNAWIPLHVAIATARVYGDLNCDGTFDNFDIDPFVLAFVDLADWQLTYSGCDVLNGDVNRDGLFNGFDIDPFVDCLLRGACP